MWKEIACLFAPLEKRADFALEIQVFSAGLTQESVSLACGPVNCRLENLLGLFPALRIHVASEHLIDFLKDAGFSGR